MDHRVVTFPGFPWFSFFCPPKWKWKTKWLNPGKMEIWRCLWVLDGLVLHAGWEFISKCYGWNKIVSDLVGSPMPTLQPLPDYSSMEECSTLLQWSQDASMVWMGYNTSWVSQIKIPSSHLARGLIFIRIFTTVVINCTLRYSDTLLSHLQKGILKYPTNVGYTLNRPW